MGINQELHVKLSFFSLPNTNMKCILQKKNKETISSKLWQKPKTIMFMELQAMHKTPIDYGLLCIIYASSLGSIYIYIL